MKLYHGSNQLIREIDLSKSKPHKDFGSGFYLTHDYTRAIRMARRTTDIEGTGAPEVTPFIFNAVHGIQTLSVKTFKGRTAEWALFVMDNRDKSKHYAHPYDVVIGPVADSAVDPILRDYRLRYGNDYRNPAHLQELAELLKYPGSEYIQYCFCTQKSIDSLILDI